jgi:hypothetical protein
MLIYVFIFGVKDGTQGLTPAIYALYLFLFCSADDPLRVLHMLGKCSASKLYC